MSLICSTFVFTVPDAAPSGVSVDILNSTLVKVYWFGIPRDRVRGHLKGYKVTNLSLNYCIQLNKLLNESQIKDIWQSLITGKMREINIVFSPIKRNLL